MKRFNWRVWAGLAIIVAGVLSYFLFFAQIPATRDVPWVSYIFFVIGAALIVIGWRRAPRKIAASVAAVLGLALIGLFGYATSIMSRGLPGSSNAPAIGEKAPDFTLPDANNKPVRLSEALAANNGVVLIFYRGYW